MGWFRFAFVSAFSALVLAACGGDSNPPGRVQMGGAIQGTSLSLTNNVTTIVGSSIAGSADGFGTAASFWNPEGITTDGKYLYVADSSNFTIRKVGIAFGNVSTMVGMAGSPGTADGIGRAARFSAPFGITADGKNLYVADSGSNTIRRIGIAFGNVSTVAGSAADPPGSSNGTGKTARFNNPRGITTDGTNLYVADSGNNTIRKIEIATRVVTTLAGSAAGLPGAADGTGGDAAFFNPQGITTNGTNLYVADYGNNTIRKIVIGSGVVTTLAGKAGNAGWANGAGGFARFDAPYGITSDGRNLYVTDFRSIVRKVVIASGVVTTLAGWPGVYGSADGAGFSVSLTSPGNIPTTPFVAFSSAGGGVTNFVSYSSIGFLISSFGDARFWYPHGITTDGRSLFVADGVNNMIRKVF